MIPEEIVAKFAHSLESFDPIYGQPSNTNITRLQDSIAPLLLQITYDETGAVHDLIRLIWLEAAYVVCYGKAFLDPTRVGAYVANIDNDAMSVVRARYEAAHKAKRADRGTYETAIQETTQFVLAVVADTWVCEFRDFNLLYTEVDPKEIFSHLQVWCTG